MPLPSTALPPVRAIAVDVLGTLVDEPAALRSALREVAPYLTDVEIEEAIAGWGRRLGREQRRIAQRSRAFADADALDAEIAAHTAQTLGIHDPAVVRILAHRNERLMPWPDTIRGIARLTAHLPVYALSNATSATLEALAARTGMRWSGVLSATDARAYKPSPAMYRLVTEQTGLPPDEVLMVAAHAWDLRGAQGIGMLTAYVSRPVGDPPRATDRFDGAFSGLLSLAEALA